MTRNIFVEKFTTVEREAVDKLKAGLPAILEKALGSQDPYTLWGVSLDKDSTDERLDVILVKFVRARNADVEKATKMLTDMLAWRKSFKVDTIKEETFDESVFGNVGYLWKTDKYGHPVCYNFYGDADQDVVFDDVEKFIRWRVQLMEKGVELLDFETVDSMVQIHDYHNVSMFGRSGKSKAAAKEIIKVMQDNYPEFLATKFFVNIPWWGSVIFKLVRPLLSEETVKKFVVCSNNELIESLTEKIDFENLPDVYKKQSNTEVKREVTSSAPAEAHTEEPAVREDAKEDAKNDKEEEKKDVQEVAKSSNEESKEAATTDAPEPSTQAAKETTAAVEPATEQSTTEKN